MDLIYRWDAIDAIYCDIIVTGKQNAETVASTIEEFVDRIKALPSAQPELDSEALIRTIEIGITATNSNDIYSLGMRNGMRWCKSLIDGVEPKFEDYVTSVDDWKKLPSAQPERQRGEWIDYSEDGYVECPFCHSATNCDGNKDELHFCFSCGADMRERKDMT